MTCARLWTLCAVLALAAAPASAQPRPPQPKPKPATPARPAAPDPAAAGEAPDDPDGEAEGEGEGEATEPTQPPPEAAGATDVEALRQEYLKLRDELFRSRARAATVASALYSTKLTVYLNHRSARFYTVTRAVVRLDGANVFDDSQGAIAADQATRFEGFVAPGRHKLTIRIEAVAKDDERFASDIENSFTFQAPAGKDVTLTANVKDDGDIAYSWNKKQKGSYKLGVDLKVDTADRGTKKARRASTQRKTRTQTARR